MSLQLTIDGREVPLEVVRARFANNGAGRLTANQATILRMLAAEGELRSIDAGVIVHANRGACGAGAKSDSWTGRGLACCPYAASDGNECLKRMAARGMVYRDPDRPGRWLAP